MSEQKRLHWDDSPGGMMGPKRLLMLGDLYVGHFYEDASPGVDVDAVLGHMVARPLALPPSPATSGPDRRLSALRSALVEVARELNAATEGDDTEEALDESLGRIAHIAASAVMTIRSELSPVVSQMPMFTRCPMCGAFHSPGHCGNPA